LLVSIDQERKALHPSSTLLLHGLVPQPDKTENKNFVTTWDQTISVIFHFTFKRTYLPTLCYNLQELLRIFPVSRDTRLV
jgi:hypothetical protein